MAVDGDEPLRLGGSVLDFLAELHHELVEGAGGAVVFDAPNFIQDGVTGDGVAAFAPENGENLHLARGEVEGFAATLATHGLGIDAHIAKGNLGGYFAFRSLRSSSAQESLHPGQ